MVYILSYKTIPGDIERPSLRKTTTAKKKKKKPNPKGSRRWMCKATCGSVTTKWRLVVRFTFRKALYKVFASWWVTTLKPNVCFVNSHSYSVAMYVYALGLTCYILVSMY